MHPQLHHVSTGGDLCPQVISIFASWDIREIPREKAVAYAKALQYFTEQNNLPKRDQPCLLVESIIELREEIRFYLSFMDEEVFQRIDLPKEEESSPPTINIAATADIPGTTDAPEASPESKAAPKYASSETVLHPSQPVLATGEIPQMIAMPKPKRRALQLTRSTSISPPSNPPKASLSRKSPLPARTLTLVRPPMPPHGFAGAAACLKTPELMEIEWEMPVGTMLIGMVMTPGLSSISLSWVVKDDTMGLVYLDTMMTSVGKVVLGRSDPNEGPIIEDITDQL